MASSTLLCLSTLLGLLSISANARPCKTLFISFYSFTFKPHFPRNPSASASASASAGGSLTVFTEIRQFNSKPFFDKTLRSPIPLRLVDPDVADFQQRPSPSGFFSSAAAFDSFRDRAKDVLSVVVALLFGVGCGALTAATMYLAWSLFSYRYEYRSSYDDFDDDDDVSPKKIGYVKIPADVTPVPAPAPAKEVLTYTHMGYNVFGNPITNSTLEGMPEYAGKTIRRTDRAHMALNMKNAENKDFNAYTYVENLKKEWGTGVSTLCLVYNATGDTVKLTTSHDWYGHIGPSPYPIEIQNGQWGGYLHVKTSGAATGSSAAVVYRGMNEAGNECDWMLSWSNPWNRLFWDNTAYTEIREARHYDTVSWDYVSNLLYNSSIEYTDEWNGCLSEVATGKGTTVIFEAIMMLQGAN